MPMNYHRGLHGKPGTRQRILINTIAAAAMTLGSTLGSPALGQEAVQTATLQDYQMQGLQAAMQTKGALGSELMKAIQAGGPENAVAFCNTQALPITAEMSSKLGMAVSRVSDQPRNPANAANDEELEIIAALKDALANGQPPLPTMRESNETVTGYYPIVTNAMCLQCHGTEGEDIDAATLAVIDSRYPHDQATGYGENELRGLFVVNMPRADEEFPAMGPDQGE
jgi:hypothetical protein